MFRESVFGTVFSVFPSAFLCYLCLRHINWAVFCAGGGGKLHHLFGKGKCAAYFICCVIDFAGRLFTTNYLIFFLGIVFVLLYDFVLCGKKAHIAFVCGLLCSMVLCNYSITVFTEKLTGIHSKGGMPGELFVMMGLSEGESGPGWWNGFYEYGF